MLASGWSGCRSRWAGAALHMAASQLCLEYIGGPSVLCILLPPLLHGRLSAQPPQASVYRLMSASCCFFLQYPEGIPDELLDVQTRAGYTGATPAGRKKGG